MRWRALRHGGREALKEETHDACVDLVEPRSR
jgi:hypothetical protein